MEAPGHCSPSRKVVSNIIILFFFIVLSLLAAPARGCRNDKKPHHRLAAMGFKKSVNEIKPQPPRLPAAAARSATVEGSNSCSLALFVNWNGHAVKLFFFGFAHLVEERIASLKFLSLS
jgi:hypothetical protein